MARIRTIKPEFPQSETMGKVSRECRLCFILLWTLADDAGRLRGNSRMLASLLYPYDDDAKHHIDGWLSDLHDHGCIVRYESDDEQFIQIAKWLSHQKIDKPSPSKIPPFDESSREFAKPLDDYVADQGKDQGVDQGEERKPRASRALDCSRFDRFWQAYPKKVGKDAARKAFEKRAPNDDLLEQMLEAVAMQTRSTAWTKDGGEFIPHPSTWLNQGRWQDETSLSLDPSGKPARPAWQHEQPPAWEGAR